MGGRLIPSLTSYLSATRSAAPEASEVVAKLRVALFTDGTGPVTRAALRALSRCFEVSATADPADLARSLGAARCAILVGPCLRGSAPTHLDAVRVVPPFVLVGTSESARAGSREADPELVRGVVLPSEIELRLVPVVASAVFSNLLVRARAAVLERRVRPLPTRLLAGLARAFDLALPPLLSVQAMAREVACGRRRLENEWSNTLRSDPGAPSLKRLLMAIVFVRAMIEWLNDPFGDWSAIAACLGPHRKTIANHARDWSDKGLDDLTAELALGLVVPMERRVFDYLSWDRPMAGSIEVARRTAHQRSS
jgi:hypothetical protein